MSNYHNNLVAAVAEYNQLSSDYPYLDLRYYHTDKQYEVAVYFNGLQRSSVVGDGSYFIICGKPDGYNYIGKSRIKYLQTLINDFECNLLDGMCLADAITHAEYKNAHLSF